MTIVHADLELCRRQCLDYRSFNLNFAFFFSHVHLKLKLSIDLCRFRVPGRPALEASNRFLLLDTAQLTLRDEPSFPANRAQNAALRHFLAESLQQLVLRLIRA
jgi:hypothetical protein